MANNFKRYTVPNVNTSSAGSATAVYSVPTGSGAINTIIIGIMLANKATSGVTVSVYLSNYDGTNNVYLLQNATIPTGASLEVMQGNKIVVQGNGSAGDVIRVSASVANSVDATISILENV
jgi:hypothetical protein